MKPFLGLRTLIFRMEDLQAGKKWYSEFLATEPYFDQPFYIGYNVGGFEVGLHPIEEGLKKGNNVETYLGVENIESAKERALGLGAKINTDIQDVGDGIKVITLLDPFDNLIGMIENPHFKVD